MKKLLILSAFVFSVNLSVYTQVTPVSGDKDLRDTNVKGRSNELERIDRETKKEDEANKNNKKKSKKKTTVVQVMTAPAAPEPAKDALAEVYPQIKEDYESMQNSQAAIMTAYGDGKNVDYAKINSLSTEISKNAVRLNANLFPAPTPATATTETNTEVKKDAEKPLARKSLRSLLIELDDAVAGVISSPMFQNLRTVEPSAAEKTKADLQKVMKLSEAVKAEAANSRK